MAPNRDEPRSTHINMALADGVILSVFDFPGIVTSKAVEGVGGLMHVAMSLPRGRFEQIEGSSKKHGVPYQRVHNSVYFATRTA